MPDQNDFKVLSPIRILLVLVLGVGIGVGGMYLVNAFGNEVPFLVRDQVMGEPVEVNGTEYAVIEQRGPLGDVWYGVGRLDEHGRIKLSPVEVNQIQWDEALPMVGRTIPGPMIAWAFRKEQQWFVWLHPVGVHHGTIQGLAHPMPDQATCVRQLEQFSNGAPISGAPIIRAEGDERSVVEIVAATDTATAE